MKTRTSSTGRQKKGNRTGFTFLELLVVLVIVSVFMATISPRIGSLFSGGDLSLAARMLTGEIGRIRGLAAYTHKGRELGFKIGAGSFYPIDLPVESVNGEAWVLDKKEESPDARKLPDGVIIDDVVFFSKGKVQEGEARIRFFPNGCVERSMIHIKNENGEVYTLKINPLTGHVKVYDSYVEERKQR